MQDAKILDIRTSPIAERIAAIDDFVAAGYEVHVNFSPVVVRDGWLADWAALLEQLDAGIGAAAKKQLAAEVIFLTVRVLTCTPNSPPARKSRRGVAGR